MSPLRYHQDTLLFFLLVFLLTASAVSWMYTVR